ncbi:cerebellin-1-like isoform 2-T2 [Menidia menidia]
MKMFFPLLLLICSVSTAQVYEESDNEIISHLGKTTSEGGIPGSVADQQQSSAPDIQSVLREMTALLAELKVEVKYLQRDNEAQAAKVKELEQQHRGELISIKARGNVTENQVEALKREGEVKRVAFSASLVESGVGEFGPFSVQTPLVFKHVVVNIGNAYNPNTGFFIAPVKGAYHFEFHIYGLGHASHPSGAVLIKNGEEVFIAFQHQPSQGAKASNSVTLLLEVGDVVFLRQWQNTMIYDNQHRHNTFSGHLLFTM